MTMSLHLDAKRAADAALALTEGSVSDQSHSRADALRFDYPAPALGHVWKLLLKEYAAISIRKRAALSAAAPVCGSGVVIKLLRILSNGQDSSEPLPQKIRATAADGWDESDNVHAAVQRLLQVLGGFAAHQAAVDGDGERNSSGSPRLAVVGGVGSGSTDSRQSSQLLPAPSSLGDHAAAAVAAAAAATAALPAQFIKLLTTSSAAVESVFVVKESSSAADDDDDTLSGQRIAAGGAGTATAGGGSSGGGGSSSGGGGGTPPGDLSFLAATLADINSRPSILKDHPEVLLLQTLQASVGAKLYQLLCEAIKFWLPEQPQPLPLLPLSATPQDSAITGTGAETGPAGIGPGPDTGKKIGPAGIVGEEDAAEGLAAPAKLSLSRVQPNGTKGTSEECSDADVEAHVLLLLKVAGMDRFKEATSSGPSPLLRAIMAAVNASRPITNPAATSAACNVLSSTSTSANTSSQSQMPSLLGTMLSIACSLFQQIAAAASDEKQLLALASEPETTETVLGDLSLAGEIALCRSRIAGV